MLSGLAVQWAYTTHDPSHRLKAVQTLAVAAVAIVVGASIPVCRRAWGMGRSNEIWAVSAAVAYSVGQFPLMRGVESASSTRAIATVTGCALIGAGTLSPSAANLGSPLRDLSGERRPDYQSFVAWADLKVIGSRNQLS